ncbi:MAG: hypothetical protein IJ588_07085 [Prevotella sp.]|nr:hypothetical protein [Prevotella sp.]
MAGNKIYVQGSYIDIHDNENVYLSVDKAEVRVADGVKEQSAEESVAVAGPCAVLRSDEALRLWAAAREAGWVDDDCQPLLSRTLSAVLADHMASLLNLKNKWKTFEAFWHRNNMRGDYNDALDQKQYGQFREKMLRLITLQREA